VANSATQAYLSANYDPNVAIDAAASAAAALASKNAAQNAEFLALTHSNYAEQATLSAQNYAGQAATARAQAQNHASAANTSKLETAALAVAVEADFNEVAAVYAASLSLKNWVDSESFQFLHKREDMSDAGAIMMFNDGEAENTLIGKVFQGASVSPDSSVVYRPPTSGTSVGNMDIYSGPWWVDGHDSPEDPHKIVMRDMMSCLVDTWTVFGPRVGPWSGGVGNIKLRQNGINGQPQAQFHIGPERIKGVNYSKDNFGVGVVQGSQPLTPKGYVDDADTALSVRIDGKANIVHTHIIGNVTGLQTALDGKSDTGHLHTGVYAPVAHSHDIADVTGLQSAIDANRIQEYDNYKIYGVGDIVLQSNKIYRFNAGIGAAGYGPSTHPYAWTEQSAQPNLSGYATESFVNSKPGLTNLAYSLNYTDIGASSYVDTPVNVVDGQMGNTYYNLTITSPQDPLVSSYAGWTVSFVGVAGSSAMSTDVQSRVVTFDVNTMASNAQDVFGTLNMTHGWLGWNFGGALATAYYVQPTEIAGKSFVLQGSTQQIQSNDKFINAKGLWSDFSNVVNDLGLGNKLIGTDNNSRTKFYSTLDFAKENEVAKKSGTTFTGKVNLATISVATPSINLGGQCDPAPASAADGDIWISNATSPKLTYKMGGVNYNLPVLNQFNTFTNQIVLDTSSSSVAALRVTQRGTGEAFRVEDSTSPDLTSFIVGNDGNVGIGYNSSTEIAGSNLAIKGRTGVARCLNIDATVNGYGIGLFGISGVAVMNVQNGYVNIEGGPSAGIKLGYNGAVVSQIKAPAAGTGVYDKEIEISIAGGTYKIPCRQV